jgi:glycerophosphoryl diester phosphodiesterase
MVLFGSHVESFRDGDNRGTDLYLVNYNEIKSLIFGDDSTEKFVVAWEEALAASEDDYRSARKDLWDRIFRVVAERDSAVIRGAHPGNALQAFVDNMHPDKVHEVLTTMDQLHRTAAVNTEALRKLVKKHDKHCNTEMLSVKLLPVLYTSSLYSSQNMLQDGIGLMRGLLDEMEMSSIVPMVRKDSEAQHHQAATIRMEELDWLKRLVASIPQEDLLPRLVAHRGFHHIQDRNDKRPIENSLSAYEVAWTSGVHLCECDIAITRDEKLVLAHDENFLRLALDSNDVNSHKHISDLTFRELFSIPLKSGVRPPLLIDVLRSACAISEKAQLVIEIKPGNEAAASALARLLARHSDLRQVVAMIMSFDAVTMHRLRYELSIVDETENDIPAASSLTGMHHRVTSFDHFGTLFSSHSHRRMSSMDQLTSSIGLSLSQTHLSQSQFESTIMEQETSHDVSGPSTTAAGSTTMPRLMLLTVANAPKRPCEQRVSVDDLLPLDSWLTMDDGSLNGVYLQFEKKMMTEEGAASLRQLSQRFVIGIWSYSGIDPDDYATFEWLVHKCNCTFVNTDLPNHFRNDVFVRSNSSG